VFQKVGVYQKETAMAIAQYIFKTSEGQWWINHDGKRHGPYATQQSAMNLAVKTAQKAGIAGRSTRVFVQGRDGKFRTEWTYGKDSVLPQG
jgi:hypothetical protein